MKKTVTALILVLLTCTFLVARTHGISWNTETVDSAGDVGLETSIAVDSGDNLHISYYDQSNGDLKYAYYDGVSWFTETVDNAGNVGLETSITLDSGDNPHISYESRSDANLKYAYYDGGWNTETVDNNVDVGGRTSIAVDSGDNPHISYRDDTNDNLKYAYPHACMPIQATVDVDPDTLNLKSNGQWITAYITLPEGYLVEEIDIATVELKYNDWALLADWGEIQENTLMVKFDRIALRDHLGEIDVSEASRFYDISLTVSGKLLDGTSFEGSDTIAVLRK